MVNTHTANIVRTAFRTGAITIAPSINTPLPTRLGDRIVWHEKNSYLRPSQYGKILPALKRIIDTAEIKFDYLIGSYTGGIPWASLLSEVIKAPMCIEENGKFYTFPTYHSLNITQTEKSDLIVANVFGIPLAANVAYTMNKPLAYIKPRSKKKEGFVLEGLYDRASSACLYEVYTPEMKVKTADYTTILEKADLEVKYGSGRPKIQPVDLRGKRILLIDDLYTSGGSSLQLLPGLQEAGALVTDVLCLFNQQTEDGKAAAQTHRVHIHSIVNSAQLIEIAASEGLISHDEIGQYVSTLTKEAVSTV